MFGDTNQRRRHERTLVVVAAACWQQRTFRAGTHAVEYTFAREPPGAFSVFCKDSRESTSSDSAPGRDGRSVLKGRGCAFAARHVPRNRERRKLQLARRF